MRCVASLNICILFKESRDSCFTADQHESTKHVMIKFLALRAPPPFFLMFLCLFAESNMRERTHQHGWDRTHQDTWLLPNVVMALSLSLTNPVSTRIPSGHVLMLGVAKSEMQGGHCKLGDENWTGTPRNLDVAEFFCLLSTIFVPRNS